MPITRLGATALSDSHQDEATALLDGEFGEWQSAKNTVAPGQNQTHSQSSNQPTNSGPSRFINADNTARSIHSKQPDFSSASSRSGGVQKAAEEESDSEITSLLAAAKITDEQARAHYKLAISGHGDLNVHLHVASCSTNPAILGAVYGTMSGLKIGDVSNYRQMAIDNFLLGLTKGTPVEQRNCHIGLAQLRHGDVKAHLKDAECLSPDDEGMELIKRVRAKLRI